eukprot:1115500-Prymnesium_polylepis.2
MGGAQRVNCDLKNHCHAPHWIAMEFLFLAPPFLPSRLNGAFPPVTTFSAAFIDSLDRLVCTFGGLSRQSSITSGIVRRPAPPLSGEAHSSVRWSRTGLKSLVTTIFGFNARLTRFNVLLLSSDHGSPISLFFWAKSTRRGRNPIASGKQHLELLSREVVGKRLEQIDAERELLDVRYAGKPAVWHRSDRVPVELERSQAAEVGTEVRH